MVSVPFPAKDMKKRQHNLPVTLIVANGTCDKRNKIHKVNTQGF